VRGEFSFVGGGGRGVDFVETYGGPSDNRFVYLYPFLQNIPVIFENTLINTDTIYVHISKY